MRVLVVPDKFKGTLTSHAAANAISRGWQRIRPHDQLEILPMSDGGDGFGEIIGDLLIAERRSADTINAAGLPCNASWRYQPATSTAVIESAQAIGLAMLPAKTYHPFDLDTFGLVNVIRAAKDAGAEKCLIGVGGSATNDGGFGLARGLGWQFLTSGGKSITRFLELKHLSKVLSPVSPIAFRECVVAVDVSNPLLGPLGCSRIYGPQKGLQADDMPAAEDCLLHLANAVAACIGHDYRDVPGAGAAGGLGFGLQAFLSARPESGFDLFARAANLEARLSDTDLVITGEGSVDQSSAMGKGAGSVARLCASRNVRCLALAGRVADRESISKLFTGAWGLTDLTSPGEAHSQAATWLETLAIQVASTQPE